MRNCDRCFTHDIFTQPTLRKKVRRSMPIMLDGNSMPVIQIMSSPNARHPKIMKNCLATLFSIYASINPTMDDNERSLCCSLMKFYSILFVQMPLAYFLLQSSEYCLCFRACFVHASLSWQPLHAEFESVIVR